MKIDVVYITGFRSLTELSLGNLDRRLNVFVGINGAGKSSILDAMKVLLRRFQLAAMDKKSKVQILDDDVQIGQTLAQLGMTASSIDGSRNYGWGVVRGNFAKREFSLSEIRESVAPLEKQMEAWKGTWRTSEESSQSQTPVSYPVLVHYPVTRAVLDIPYRTRKKMKFGDWSAWEESLEVGIRKSAANFRTFFTWYRQQEDLENERIRDDRSYNDPQLDCVRKAVDSFLPGYSDLRIRRSPVRMTLKKGDQEFSVQQFSDGEKCLISLVGDLARRLAMANPDSVDPLQESGIVLIDELDLHLHPQWQIDVIPRLLETFPGCQFMITTHSPLLVSHVQQQQLWLVRNEGGKVMVERPTTNTYGQDMNVLVSAYMGTAVRERKTEELLKAIFAQLADPTEWRNAVAMIARAREINADLPDLVKAQAILERKELLAR